MPVQQPPFPYLAHTTYKYFYLAYTTHNLGSKAAQTINLSDMLPTDCAFYHPSITLPFYLYHRVPTQMPVYFYFHGSYIQQCQCYYLSNQHIFLNTACRDRHRHAKARAPLVLMF